MLQLVTVRFKDLSPGFFPAGPGPMVGQHILNTNCGALFTDRWPDPHLVYAQVGHNLALSGDPAAVSAEVLGGMLVPGVVDADKAFEGLLRKAVDDVKIWSRLIYRFQETRRPPETTGFSFRRLTAGDAPALQDLAPSNHWIWNTWETANGLAESGFAWGAFQSGLLASVACSFFVGTGFEDIGVVTEPEYRNQGLSTACVCRLCADILGRRRVPSWSTSPDNTASRRVAEKSGFSLDRRDFLFVIDAEIPD